MSCIHTLCHSASRSHKFISKQVNLFKSLHLRRFFPLPSTVPSSSHKSRGILAKLAQCGEIRLLVVGLSNNLYSIYILKCIKRDSRILEIVRSSRVIFYQSISVSRCMLGAGVYRFCIKYTYLMDRDIYLQANPRIERHPPQKKTKV